MSRFSWWLACVACLAVAWPTANGDEIGLSVPEGFEVALFSGDELATNTYTLTFDHQGQVVVSGPGYIKRLRDTTGDGQADTTEMVFEGPRSGAKGLLFDHEGHLYFTGDNGLWQVRDTNGDGRCDGEPQRWTNLRHPEHGANGLCWGPDGHLWLICGNDAAIQQDHAGPGSPIRRPECGGVLRFTPDGQQSIVFAHGFRNPYDLCFNADGHVFTFDSDGEREHKLPWYTPTRFFDVAAGRHHGWIETGWTRSWAPPESFFDNVPRLVNVGRGSPTGMFAYQHRGFPERYRDGIFGLCWTYGRLYFVPLERQQSSYAAELETLMETTGDVGFAPVDAEVGPDGAVYMAIGGRGTRGGVFRLRHTQPLPDHPAGDDPLDQVLLADQPLSAWSRARWIPLAKELGREAFAQAAVDRERGVSQRRRAIDVLLAVFEGVDTPLAQKLARDDAPEIRTAVAWALGYGEATPERAAVLSDLARDAEPTVLRRAWEVLAARPELVSADWEVAPLAAAVHPDSLVRWAVTQAVRHHPDGQSSRLAQSLEATHQQTPSAQSLLAIAWAGDPAEGPSRPRLVEAAIAPQADGEWVGRLFPEPSDDDAAQALMLESLRRLQVELGAVPLMQPSQQPDSVKPRHEVLTGFVPTRPETIPAASTEPLAQVLEARFPWNDERIDQEIARTAGMLERGLFVTQKLTAESDPQDDIHYLIVLSRAAGERSADDTLRTAYALANLNRKYAERGDYPSDRWPDRVGELFTLLQEKDPKLAEALIEQDAFGRPEHTLFVRRMPAELRQAATLALFEVAQRRWDEGDDDNELEPVWTPDLIRLLGSVPPERALPVLRELWPDQRYRDDVTLVLARHRQPEDRDRLIECLQSTQFSVVKAAAGALQAMSRQEEGPVAAEDFLSALVGLRRQSRIDRGNDATDPAVLALLAAWGERSGVSDERLKDLRLGDGELDRPGLTRRFDAWQTWFEGQFPEVAEALVALGGQTAAAWDERLAGIDWTTGDVNRGRVAFEKASCHKCHQGTSRLGPDLAGVGSRMSRQDMFVAILEPSRDVSPTYHTTIVRTRGGKTYVGMSVYQSPDGTLLQTGPGETVRINGDDILSQDRGAISLMPTGLIDTFTDQELADLYAYMRTLR